VVGGIQVVFELLAYHTGSGPYGYVFEESPYAIGWVEAHGLAFIIGVLLLTVAARDLRRFWHLLAAAVHMLLGTANLVFAEQLHRVRHGADGHRGDDRSLRVRGCAHRRVRGVP